MSSKMRTCPYCGEEIAYNQLRRHLPCSAVDTDQTTLEVTVE